MPPFYLSMPPLYFKDFGLSFLSLLWILFHVYCLLFLHLFVCVGFYLAPSLLCVSLSSLSSNLLCLCSDFHWLQSHSSSYKQSLLPVDSIGSVLWLAFLCWGLSLFSSTRAYWTLVGSKKTWTDKTLIQMVKVVLKLNRQKHKMKLTHSHSWRERKKKERKQ